MRFTLGLLLATSALAQAPVPLINPRGVVDYYNPTPAPATIGRGGILLIQGTNLGPATTVTAKAGTLPTSLGSPAVEALLDGEAMPLFSVSANQIIAQIPYDANTATLSVTVSVGGVTGPSASVTVVATQPSIQTANGEGTGMYAGTVASGTITLAVSGLGVTRPALVAGDLPPRTGAAPMTAIVAYVGGVRAISASTASLTKVGVFDVKIDVPPTAQPGDLIYLVSAGRPSNAVVYEPLSAPSMAMQPIPAGSPSIVGLTTPDVSGFFVIPYAAADATGCSASLWFDMNALTSGTLNSCLAPPSRTATTPIVLPANSEVAGGLVGPPAGAAPAGVSSTVIIASADDDSVNSVTLAGNASTLAGNINALFVAAIPGPPAETQTINGITDVVNTITTGAGAGAAGAAALTANVNGLTSIVTTPVTISTGVFGVVVVDDPIVPTQAAYAVVQTGGTVVASQKFSADLAALDSDDAESRGSQCPGGVAPGRDGQEFLRAGSRRGSLARRVPGLSRGRFERAGDVRDADRVVRRFVRWSGPHVDELADFRVSAGGNECARHELQQSLYSGRIPAARSHGANGRCVPVRHGQSDERRGSLTKLRNVDISSTGTTIRARRDGNHRQYGLCIGCRLY